MITAPPSADDLASAVGIVWVAIAVFFLLVGGMALIFGRPSGYQPRRRAGDTKYNAPPRKP